MLLPDLSPMEMGRLFRLAGRARGESAGPYAGLKLLEMAIPWALKAKDWDCLGGARADAGSFWLMVGDIAQAIDYLQAYILDFSRYDTARASFGHVHYNLGLAYRRRRDHQRAVEHYEKAVQWFTEKGYTLHAGATHQNLAWLYCLDGNLDEAATELAIAETFAAVSGPSFQVEQLVCRALWLYLKGQLGDAMKLVEEVLQPGRAGAKSAHKGNAAWIAGKVALFLHRYDEVRFFADLATEHAMSAADTSIMNGASELKAEAARQQGFGNQAAQ